MELPQGTQNDVFKQKKDEAVNKSFTTAGFREFILTTHPNPDVMSTLYLCHYAERMHAGNGTRVTLTDATHGEVFEQTSSTINDLTPLKRKPYLVQVTVWDAKQKNGCYGNTIIDFKPYCPTQMHRERSVVQAFVEYKEFTKTTTLRTTRVSLLPTGA
ncbi:hypothetical protein PR003_g7253 [Phytophthora rubi]|uniref:Uncharacterized protein n=1 Tax=Phytophthora rubi TaxID=129364 RepID=A0A6A4FMX8_9STRA|nr:hypothetical protein PR003_g7253 [Phytophthora rubi]